MPEFPGRLDFLRNSNLVGRSIEVRSKESGIRWFASIVSESPDKVVVEPEGVSGWPRQLTFLRDSALSLGGSLEITREINR